MITFFDDDFEVEALGCEEPQFRLGDLSGEGVLDSVDLGPFVRLLSGP